MLKIAYRIVSIFMVLSLLVFTFAIAPAPVKAQVIAPAASAPLYPAVESPVVFTDVNFATVIRNILGKPTGDIFPSDMVTITNIQAGYSNIQNLTGIEYCTELTTLFLLHNNISDVTPLANLTKLKDMWLCENNISDISMLGNLTNLETFWITTNNVVNIGAVSGMTKLKDLKLVDNKITDISALDTITGIGAGVIFRLDMNYLDTTPGSDDMAIIQSLTNKGVSVTYANQKTQTLGPWTLTVSPIIPANAGTVTKTPDFATYTNNTTVTLTAVSGDNWTFSHWSAGVTDSNSAQTTIVMDANKTVTAYFTQTGEQPVNIPDAIFLAKIRELINKPTGDIMPSDLLNIVDPGTFFAGTGIQNITGMEFFTNLEKVYLCFNSIGDLQPLASLTRVTKLWATNETGQLSNISALRTMTGLNEVNLSNNVITDIYPLVENTGITSGDLVNLQGNPLDLSANSTTTGYITTLRTRGVTVITDNVSVVEYSPSFNVNPPEGGSITKDKPGPSYPAGTVVRLTAVPASGYSFTGWTGCFTSSYNPVDLTINGSLSVVANFVKNPVDSGDTTGQIGNPGGGGGGGFTGGLTGGSATVQLKRVTSLMQIITDTGMLIDSIEAFSISENVAVILPVYTMCYNSAKAFLGMIVIEEMVNVPNGISADGLFGSVFSLQPEGASFSPEVKLVFKYDPKKLPVSAKEENLKIVWWDKNAKAWVELKSEVDTVKHTVTTWISHFSYYSMMVKVAPANFEIKEVSLGQEELNKGDSTQVKAVIANTGDLTGDYQVVLKVNGVKQEEKSVTIAGGGSADVSFDIAFDKSGSYALSINDIEKTLKVLPSPASFKIDGLTVAPLSGQPGEDIQVSFTVFNSGEVDGSYAVSCLLDGSLCHSQDVPVPANASEKVAFSLKLDKPGVHNIAVSDSLSENFEIKAPPAPATTKAEAAAPSTPPSETATASAAADNAGSNLGTILLISAGGLLLAVVVGMLVVSYIRRRQGY